VNSSSEPFAALEIGTTRTVLAVGEPLDAGRVKITAKAVIPSSGVRKSEIIDIRQVTYSLNAVLKEIQDKEGYAIGTADLAVSGPHIETRDVSTQRRVDGKTVESEDVDAIYDGSFDNGLGADRIVLDVAELGYGLDGREGIANPRGMTGHMLTLRTHVVHAAQQRIEDARTAARQSKIDIRDISFAGSCAAWAVLTPADRREGALHIDLGAGSTTWTVWSDGRLIHAGVLGVGGDHVTNDIRQAFGLTLTQAETLKTSESDARLDLPPGERITIASDMPGFEDRSISRRALATVVDARLQEIFSLVAADVDRAGLVHRIGGDIVLTGGGAAQRGILPLARRLFGRRVRVGTPVPEIEGLENVEAPESFATVAGLLLRRRADTTEDTGWGKFKNIFGGIFRS